MITSLNDLDFSKKYTYKDYLSWKFEEYVELIKGIIFKMSTPNREHQAISGSLYLFMGNALWKSPSKVYSAPFDVRLTHLSKAKNDQITTVVQPDICVICDPKKLDKKGCIGAPDLIVEILSPGNSNKEMKQKFEIYEESGVKEYWIVHPTERMLQRFVLNEHGKYVGLAPLIEGDLATTPIIEGLEIPLTDVFRD